MNLQQIYTNPFSSIERQKIINFIHMLCPRLRAGSGFSWERKSCCLRLRRINKTHLWRIHRGNPLIPPQARVDIYCDCASVAYPVVCLSGGAGFNHPQCLTTDPSSTSLTWDTLQSTIRPPSRSKGRRSTIWRSTIDAPIFPPFGTHLKHCHHIRFKIKWDEWVDEKSYMEKRSLPLRAKIKIWIYMTYALWLRCDKGWVDSDNYKFFPRVAACPLCIMSCQVALPRSHRAANQRDIQRETSPCKNFPTLLIPGQIQIHIFLNQNYNL